MKKILSLLLSAVMLTSVLGGISTNALATTNGYTRTSAASYIENTICGTGWNIDGGGAGYDCVDLVYKYFRDLGNYYTVQRGNAYIFANSATLPSGWTRQYRSNGYTPQKGDIACWGTEFSSTGHVALVYAVDSSYIYVVEQASTKNIAAYKAKYAISSPKCFIVPDFDEIKDFVPVDIGTDFYGSIVNLAINKPIKVSQNNVVLGVRDGSDEQKWKFERQADNSYKIINVATGCCLDDDNYGTKDNSNIKVISSNDETAQRWYFRSNGTGYSLIPKCATNLAMDLVNGANQEGSNVEGSNVAAWTFVADNPNQIYGIDLQPSFTPQNLGNHFYASIIHSSSDSAVSITSSGNVVIKKYAACTDQIWEFVLMDDRLYKIINIATGCCLDDDNYGTQDNTNIKTIASNNESAQMWYLWKNGNGYSLVPKCAMNLAMDLVSGNTSDGSNLAAWTRVSGNTNQIFTINKVLHIWDNGSITKPATYTATGIKTYTCTVCGETKTETLPKLAKKANPIVAKGKTVTVKYAKVKKKNQTIALKNAMTVSKAQGKVTYTKSSGNKKITVSKAGKLTVKKGLKKGTYKVKVKVKATGNTVYKARTVTVTVTVKVK